MHVILPKRVLGLPLALACAAFSLGASSSASQAASLEKVNISYAEKTVDFLPIQIAEDAGYYKKHGIDATVRYLPAQEGIPALLSGQEQIVAIGGSDAISAVAAGTKLNVVLTLTPIYIFQLWAQPKYATASALKGRRVGITSTTGSLYSATLRALDELGLKSSDVIITPLGSTVNVNNSLRAGSIAAGCSHPPATYQLERGGLVDIVDLAKKRIPSLSAGVWATPAYIKTHRRIMQGMVDAVNDALNREKTDRAYTETEIAKYFGIKDKAELDFTYNFYVNEVLPVGATPQVAQLKSDQQSLSRSNPKVKSVDVASMIDTSFMEKVAK